MYLEDKVEAEIGKERERIDKTVGRPDASWYESYGRLKEAVERVQENLKPMGKVLNALWDGIARANDDEDVALVHQLGRDARTIACSAIRAAALASRAEASSGGIWELPSDEGENTTPEQAGIDEATGEVVDSGAE